jgi:hypothetical protein
MEANGSGDYDEFMNRGAVEQCPVCPHPGVNLPANWIERDHAYVT